MMKNCEPLVSLPELAMDSLPGLSCFSAKFSSGNLAPYTDSPPRPSPVYLHLVRASFVCTEGAQRSLLVKFQHLPCVKSPPCSMNWGITLHTNTERAHLSSSSSHIGEPQQQRSSANIPVEDRSLRASTKYQRVTAVRSCTRA